MPVWIAPDGYFIDHAVPGEAKVLAQIHGRNFYRGWSEAEFDAYIVQKNMFLYVVRRGTKKVAGMLIIRQTEDEAEILSIAIDRKWRKKGFANALMSAGIDEITRFGVRKLFLEVNEDNVGARKLYARYGFEIIATRAQYYQIPKNDRKSKRKDTDEGKPASALVMRCDLG